MADNLGRVLPLSRPCEARAPIVEDLPQRSVHRQSEWTAQQGSSTQAGNKGGCELLQDGVEVPAPHPEMIHGEGDEALSGARLYRFDGS